jgi:putative PEP-CTERM system histidine kinase
LRTFAALGVFAVKLLGGDQMTPILFTLNILLLLSALVNFRLTATEKLLSLSLVRSLLCLPLLAAQYLYLSYDFLPETATVILFSENVFGIVWLFTAVRFYTLISSLQEEHKLITSLEIVLGAIAVVAAFFYTGTGELRQGDDGTMIFQQYGPVFVYAIFALVVMILMAWRLEAFWRSLPQARRWEYKFLVVAGYLICIAMIWAASFRITYLQLVRDHMLLLGLVLIIAWGMMLYAVARHRLLNRKLFVSRKIVYSAVGPFIFACYFLAVGVISLLMRTLHWPLHFSIFWVLMALGLSAAGLYVCSGKLRKRVHFFISTHFYVNKYEYRDEWLAFSRLLQGALSTEAIVSALKQVLMESLYTTNIMIWLADEAAGYSLVSSPVGADEPLARGRLSADDALPVFLGTHDHFYLKEPEPDAEWRHTFESAGRFLMDRYLVLAVPLTIRDQLVGLIGLGPEYTGGRYGHDDYDLLTALGTQAASALLAVQMAEELSRTRQREAWNRLSTFVLHDIKNAATMLSLVRDNAPDYMDNPVFQKDMLESIDNALKRMSKVQQRLMTLKGDITPELCDLDLAAFLHDFGASMCKRVPQVSIKVECSEGVKAETDQGILFSALENLLLNALEAGATEVKLSAASDGEAEATVTMFDNGTGVPEELLPEKLFEPFKTTKPKGSGIGLWQVKELVVSLGGKISVRNQEEGGALFSLRLPKPLTAKMQSTQRLAKD